MNIKKDILKEKEEKINRIYEINKKEEIEGMSVY